jgi:purine-binding chemotaxis protein CheW
MNPDATRHLLSCLCGPHTVGFDLTTVQEVLTERPITRVPRTSTRVCGLLNLRGTVVPALSLHQALGMPPLDIGSTTHRHIIIALAQSVVSLVVNNVGDVIEIDPAQHFTDIAGIASPLRDISVGIYTTAKSTVLHLDPELCCRIKEDVRL